MQYTNIVGIDPSTTCTGLYINGEAYCIAPEHSVYNRKAEMVKWYKLASEYANIRTFSKEKYDKNFTDSELQKLSMYDDISNRILGIILDKVDDVHSTICIIEGFSYNAAADHLIDLVTFSTLLRVKLYNAGFALEIVPPATLKLLSAKLTYEPINVGKKKPKLEWRNSNGVSGGKFTKHDMLSSIAENSKLKEEWAEFIKSNFETISSMKSIPKPIEDINDAYLLYKTFNTVDK